MRFILLTLFAIVVFGYGLHLEALAQTKKKKKELAVTIPEAITVVQRGAAYLTIIVDRNKVEDDVRIEFEGLPTGILIVTKERTIEEDDPSLTFKLKADETIAAGSEHKIRVIASAGARSKTDNVIIAVKDHSLHSGGMAVMIVSVGSVLALITFCLYRVLSLPPVEVEEHFKGPLEIDTGDTQDAD